MNTNLSFHRTLGGSLKSNVNTALWDHVLMQYENGNYVDAIRECINYINPSIEKKFANSDKTEYHVPHGSVIVNVKITAKEFIVDAPFLNIEGSRQIPVLRQVAQLNFLPLILTRIELSEDKLFFRYNAPLELCEPYKVYDVLREICINADNYDDEFISKFDAKRIQEPQIYPYDTQQKDAAWNNTQLYIKEALEVYEQLENKRLTTYLWDVLMITLLKIDYYCAPQGRLRGEIEKTFIYMNSKDDYYQRLSEGKEFLKKLQTYDKSKFEADLYKIDVFVPYKFRTTLETVRNGLKYTYDTADKEIKSLDPVGAAYTLQYGILNFFYTNNVEDAIADILTVALENASGKPMSQTSSILFSALNRIMTTDDFLIPAVPVSVKENKTRETGEKSFFKKIFGG